VLLLDLQQANKATYTCCITIVTTTHSTMSRVSTATPRPLQTCAFKQLQLLSAGKLTNHRVCMLAGIRLTHEHPLDISAAKVAALQPTMMLRQLARLP
jgi:hypothetical protein